MGLTNESDVGGGGGARHARRVGAALFKGHGIFIAGDVKDLPGSDVALDDGV